MAKINYNGLISTMTPETPINSLPDELKDKISKELLSQARKGQFSGIIEDLMNSGNMGNLSTIPNWKELLKEPDPVAISVKELLSVVDSNLNVADKDFNDTISCVQLDFENNQNYFSKFYDLIVSNTYITSVESIHFSEVEANWSDLIEKNYDLFESFSNAHWNTTYEDKEVFIDEWINELQGFFSGKANEDIYKIAYEHFKDIKPSVAELSPEKISPEVIKKLEKNDDRINTVERKTRLFIDMDGTIAEFKAVDTLERLYEKNYFFNLKPNQNVITAINLFMVQNPDVEVYILSAVLTDSKYALAEKNAWLDKHLPAIKEKDRIFVPCGSDKGAAIRGGITDKDYLLDDYTINLNSWDPPAKGIKLYNSINGTKGTWKKNRISHLRAPGDIASCIKRIMDGELIQDVPPQIQNMSRSLNTREER